MTNAENPNKRIKKLQIRLSTKELNRIRILAKEYAGGSITKWILHGALNAPREYLSPNPKRKTPL